MSVEILIGDCRERMAELPNESAHCCVTSPPYFGLRDYGVDGQLGLEATPSDFVEAMVEVFREVRRVLRADGTLWLNLGDSYARSDKKGGSGFGGKNQAYLGDSYARAHSDIPPGLKAKDLIGIPWRVAFALQADGWYLRQDIIWHKPNPMPESVRDRCTKAHEYVFMLSKSERYFYDTESVQEPLAVSSVPRLRQNIDQQIGTTRANGGAKKNGNFKAVGDVVSGMRNKRSVWTVTTQPFKGAHFATFPPALIEPCILAGCPEGGTVLDPFGGAGTTGLVAQAKGRNAVLCELNPEYAAMARDRIDAAVATPLQRKALKAKTATPAARDDYQVSFF